LCALGGQLRLQRGKGSVGRWRGGGESGERGVGGFAATRELDLQGGTEMDLQGGSGERIARLSRIGKEGCGRQTWRQGEERFRTRRQGVQDKTSGTGRSDREAMRAVARRCDASRRLTP
jgi:hypothetical protein